MENGREGDAAKFLEENPNPVLCISREGVLLYANRGSLVVLDYWKRQVGETVPQDWLNIVCDALASQREREIEVRIGIRTMMLHVVPISDQGYAQLYGLDVTGRRRAEEKLRLNAQVFDSTTEAIAITDVELKIIEVNRAFCLITGYPREEVLGTSLISLHSGPQDSGFYQGIWDTVRNRGSWQGEVWDRRKNGETYAKWLSVSAAADEQGEIERFVVVFSDITPIKRTEEELYHLAHYDSLTGLANRRQFQDLLDRALKIARRKEETLAVMFIDLDSFKEVNDRFGHRVGDQLLKEVACRIRRCVRETDTVARMGGDEFTVILSHLQDANNIAAIAHKLIQRIAEPVILEQNEVRVTSSIGISVLGEGAKDLESLIQNADLAMYRAKAAGKNAFQFF